jgi:F0F1-type ATP synthase assembly protein I
MDMSQPHTTKHLLKETILIFVGITLVGLVIELTYNLIKGLALGLVIDEWVADNTRQRSIIIRLIISFGLAYFGILRKEAKLKKQSKAE